MEELYLFGLPSWVNKKSKLFKPWLFGKRGLLNHLTGGLIITGLNGPAVCNVLNGNQGTVSSLSRNQPMDFFLGSVGSYMTYIYVYIYVYIITR